MMAVVIFVFNKVIISLLSLFFLGTSHPGYCDATACGVLMLRGGQWICFH